MPGSVAGQQEFEASENGHCLCGNWTGIASMLPNIRVSDFWTKPSNTLPLSLKKKCNTISKVIASWLLTVNMLWSCEFQIGVVVISCKCS